MVNSPQFNEQKELFRALRKQLEATDLKLAKQKWLLEKFLQSPSWRLTFPVRWLATRMRALRRWTTRADQDTPVEGASRTTDSVERDAAYQQPEESVREHNLPSARLTTRHTPLSTPPRLDLSHLDLSHNDKPEISVITVLSSRAEHPLMNLCSPEESVSGHLQVFIVDSADSDGGVRLLEPVDIANHLRRTESPHLLSRINEAARQAAGQYLLLLGRDVEPLPGSIASALAALQGSPGIGAVCGRIIGTNGLLEEAGGILWNDGSRTRYGAGEDPCGPMYMFRRDVDCSSAGFMLTPREVWQRLAGFDEGIEVECAEEDYCVRLHEAGLRVVYEPNAAALRLAARPARHREPIESFTRRHARFLAEQWAPDSRSVIKARTRSRRKRILFIEDRVPHAWLGSGLPRARAILLSLVKQGYFVTFYPMTMEDEDWLSVYSETPAEVEFLMGYGRFMLEAFLNNRRGYYDILLISRPHNMALVRSIRIAHPEWFEKTALIYDAEAVFARREISRRELQGLPYRKAEARRQVREETALASEADAVISVSEFERTIFLENGIPRVHVLGHALVTRPTPRQFEDRQGFLFVGTIQADSDPNGDSILWFLTEVFPKIRAELGEDVTMRIVGVNYAEGLERFAGPSVCVSGFVRELSGIYDAARVFVAPTRYAAGIPHKVHEAAAYGVPVVATPLLADQLGWRDGATLSIGTGADSFARKCIELYTNKMLWTTLRRAALERVEAECSPEAFESRLNEILTADHRRPPASSPAI